MTPSVGTLIAASGVALSLCCAGGTARAADAFSLHSRVCYFGPCTPPGDWHHYTFTLIATDIDPKALQPGLSRDELFAALSGHAKSAAGLIGRFRHP